MYHKKIEYTDFNGNKQTEDLYFHLRKDELADFAASDSEGVDKKIARIIDPIGLDQNDTEEQAAAKIRDKISTQDIAEIMNLYRALILAAYGEKSEDGKRFIKNAKLREEFEQSAAFEAMFDEISQNAAAANAFIEGCVPGIAEAQKAQQLNLAK